MRADGYLILLASASLVGCSSLKSLIPGESGCLDPDGQATAISVVKDSIEKRVASETSAGLDGPSASKIRAVLDQIKFVLEDVRTTKEDPNSTKRFCTAKLKISLPSLILADAEKVAEISAAESISKQIEASGAERNANSILIDIDFSVQPTDDGGKIYSEVENPATTSNLIASFIGGHLLRKTIEQAHRDAETSARIKQQEEQAAENEQRQAAYDEAKAAYDLSMQSINASWSALSSDSRDRILPLQRAWIRRKDADCKIEAVGRSTDPTDQELSRLQCQARMNNERSQIIRGTVRGANYEDNAVVD